MKNHDAIPIVIVSPSEFPGSSGDTYNFLELIDQILLEGYKVLLICPKSSAKDHSNFEDYDPNLEILRINCKPPRLIQLGKENRIKDYIRFVWFLLLETTTILRLIRARKIKKIYMRHHILTMQLPLFFRLLGITTLVDGEIAGDTVKHLMPSLLFRLFSLYEKKIIKFYSYFRVDSISQVENLVAMGYPRDRTLIIPVSINTEKVTKFKLENIPEHTFGYFGGLETWQRVDVLLEAFKLLVTRIPSALLYIIGTGPLLEDLKKIVLENDLATNVVFVGKIGREKLWNDYFGKFRVIVVPRQEMNNSIDARLPMKLVESMAGGKPIIAADIPVMREIVGNPLILVPSGDPKLLANAMYYLTINPEEMAHRSSLVLKCSSNYDIKNNVKKMISILKH
jgi:glycosyltransferase involved in cell wall biosynthesis